MKAKLGLLLWIVIFVSHQLSTVALADSAASAVPATPADPEKLMAQAEDALGREELDMAMKLYFQAAELNYTPAQAALGEYAETGQFFEAAVGWYLMAASQGNAAGQYGLAKMYFAGTGIDKDEMKALYWYRRSAAKNYMPAVRVIANTYRTGGFSGQIKIDPVESKSWEDKLTRLESIATKEAAKKSQQLKEEAAARRKARAEEGAKLRAKVEAENAAKNK